MMKIRPSILYWARDKGEGFPPRRWQERVSSDGEKSTLSFFSFSMLSYQNVNGGKICSLFPTVQIPESALLTIGILYFGSSQYHKQNSNHHKWINNKGSISHIDNEWMSLKQIAAVNTARQHSGKSYQ
mmetsp:Transcript_21530/g.44920  ORF Transcript_21530/g.44920 Transcript_21530/m.44920 type:complete len:128 (+) Transcript_21530:199-582(+)